MEKNGDIFQYHLEYDDDDDVFYAEIRRQILLLTSEDNEDVETQRSNSRDGGNGRLLLPCFVSEPQDVSHFSYWADEKSSQVPTWLVKLWKNGKGTGVFIPQNVKCRTNHRRGSVKNNRRRTYKPVDNRYT